MTADLAPYVGLFLAAFMAATLFPTASEAVLVGLLVTGQTEPWILLVVATTGNVLGSVVNWWLGLWIEHFREHPWFPVSGNSLARAQAWYQRYGKWSLLLSWAPIIGDPLTLIAGVMREPFPVFLVLVTLAKCGRYLAITLTTLAVL